MIATKSNMFAAVVAGAAATNLTSDFNQLWKSSGTSQHRYDYYGQGRFGVNPFDDRELYLKGKPAPEWMTKGIPYLKKKALK